MAEGPHTLPGPDLGRAAQGGIQLQRGQSGLLPGLVHQLQHLLHGVPLVLGELVEGVLRSALVRLEILRSGRLRQGDLLVADSHLGDGGPSSGEGRIVQQGGTVPAPHPQQPRSAHQRRQQGEQMLFLHISSFLPGPPWGSRVFRRCRNRVRVVAEARISATGSAT